MSMADIVAALTHVWRFRSDHRLAHLSDFNESVIKFSVTMAVARFERLNNPYRLPRNIHGIDERTWQSREATKVYKAKSLRS